MIIAESMFVGLAATALVLAVASVVAIVGANRLSPRFRIDTERTQQVARSPTDAVDQRDRARSRRWFFLYMAAVVAISLFAGWAFKHGEAALGIGAIVAAFLLPELVFVLRRARHSRPASGTGRGE
jgi:hypothetical protein